MSSAVAVKPLVPLILNLPTQEDSLTLQLLSDLHLGSANLDEGLLKQELEEAKWADSRILIAGDWGDFLLPSDRARFSPSVLHPRLQGRDDVVNATVEWAAELLAPVAHRIDLIGTGNHEAQVEKRHSTDPTKLLIERLEAKTPGHKILYGGYSGLVVYRFRVEGVKGLQRFVISYHHGSGTTSTVRTTVENLQKRAAWVPAADLYWQGHQHTQVAFKTLRMDLDPSGRTVFRPVSYVATGAYTLVHSGQTQAEVMEKGHRQNYGLEKELRPHGLGGATVELSWGHGGLQVHVRQ